ncbi:hypothetical protein [Dyadobacter fermentans]|uniref:Uncharacterized protein n=1 Tax=Dyadobacter fermentans (strain ATCC 700827 / DSM 18053 / CIP 107007 / KCTC 52180 / NS114) TaxID=471854 RepID=C6W2A7_DYAFD|nr:hypothetical protein [Dyadobacter fermentans]ACT92080.1 hypothetical protein Dfer_0820 [Dyadobacter fermentans DSM 18053]
MSSNSEVINPLFGVSIGSTIYALTGKFSSSVVRDPISLMITQEESQKSMSGESSYVYSDKMNQGSFGMSGAYGVSGASLLKSSLSAYVGNSSAVSSKSVSVNYNAMSVGGVEYINFEELTASDFIAGLNLACQQSILAVLDAYNAVMAESSRSGLNPLNALGNDDPQSKLLKDLVTEWINKSERFTREFADGLVVGVIWGAFGGVKMVMTADSSSQSWKYGGQADFSYANVFASVAVKATYDGSQSGGDAKVAVNCTSYVSGSVLAPQIDKWLDQVVNKSFSELADVKVMDKAPDMKITQGAPTIPDFVKPKPGSDIAGKVGEIKDLEGLEALAKASAYDKAKKENPNLTLDEFLRNADKPADRSQLIDFEEDVSESDIDTLALETAPRRKRAESVSAVSYEGKPLQAEKAAQEVSTKGYVPLGVWIANWPDLFPWMAQGYYNSIDHIDGEGAVRARVMLQDYQALSRLYYIADSSGITEFKRKDPSQPRVTALSIADAFANAAGKIQDIGVNFGKMQEIYQNLGEAPRAIYALWNKVSFLRNCELGLGLIKDGKTVGAPLQNKDNDGTRQTYSLSNCSFDGRNYTVFSPFYKVLPLLTPDGDIWAFGPAQGGLSSIYEWEVVFTKPGRAKYLEFQYDQDKKLLRNADNGVKLYPIPFSAAGSVSWKGMSFSTNVGAITALNKSLQSLNEQLSRLNAWSFSSANWDRNWNGKDAYRQRNIKKQYIGLIDEIRNVF